MWIHLSLNFVLIFNLSSSIFFFLFLLITILLLTYLGGDIGVQLSLVNCLGVLVNVDDHTLLSRVNIFYTLEELIESTLCGNGERSGVEDGDVDADAEIDAVNNNRGSSTAHLSRSLSQTLPNPPFNSTLYPCPPPPSQSARGLQLLTRAAMKLFIFLALQVATSGEREMSYMVSKFVAISLKRARSGKEA